jgi:hypothetical protein
MPGSGVHLRERIDALPENFRQRNLHGICGGPERYMVTITEHRKWLAQLLDPEEPSQVREEIMCGGQLTSFARLFLVDLQTTLIPPARSAYWSPGPSAPRPPRKSSPNFLRVSAIALPP